MTTLYMCVIWENEEFNMTTLCMCVIWEIKISIWQHCVCASFEKIKISIWLNLLMCVILENKELRNESYICSVDRGINQKMDGKLHQCA